MFKRIKQSMTIEKAFLLLEQSFLPMKPRFDQLPFPDKAAFREHLRVMQSEGLELHDVAVMITCPFLPTLDRDTLEQLGGQVFVWKMEKLVQNEVYDFFRSELDKYL